MSGPDWIGPGLELDGIGLDLDWIGLVLDWIEWHWSGLTRIGVGWISSGLAFEWTGFE